MHEHWCSFGVLQAKLIAPVLTSEQPRVFLQLDEDSTPKIGCHIKIQRRGEAESMCCLRDNGESGAAVVLLPGCRQQRPRAACIGVCINS